ncbi:MAG: alginate O-acetyltransferase [Bacteroidetes bacterium RBG_13_46_8]|nr:MAG: alginate O-acetyltransferase [Bacteroidetes bacterium RBG_13_46_8]
MLLGASCYFYMVFVPVYILILGFTIVVDYFAGILLETIHKKWRKMFLIASIIANVGVLAFFKYYNFLNENLTVFLRGFSVDNPVPYLSILLPIGLSFHTFQAMSYTFEVYRGHQKAERHFGIYALYVMFFPQLVAGPIERPQNMLHQFHEKHYIDYYRIAEGIKLILWGMFKKVVIADRLSEYVNVVYNNPTEYQGPHLILATVFFSFQIYCDFSGYSDIARGTARILGYNLMVNFRRPYLSKSIHEFWGRWHISLSTWFRDYLYISMGGNRVSVPRHYFNLFFVFLISGLWHGANYTFIIWGAMHGFYLVFAKFTEPLRNRINTFMQLPKFPGLFNLSQGFITFILATYAWIFFRATSLQDALYITKNLFNWENVSNINLFHFPVDLYLSFALIILLFVFDGLEEKLKISERLKVSPAIVRWAVYATSVIVLVVLGVWKSADFIYFQF